MYVAVIQVDVGSPSCDISSGDNYKDIRSVGPQTLISVSLLGQMVSY